MRRAHLIATAGVLLALFVACYPSAECVTGCGETFTGSDCAGLDRLESATIAAFATCDAGSPDDACAALQGWRVDVLPESQTFPIDDAGARGWAPSPTEAAQLCLENPKTCDGGGYVSGETVRPTRTVTLADEAWSDGNAATELVHVATGEFSGNPYPAWLTNGRACVVAVTRSSPLVLTGSQGEGP
jgi:hypothetical protein